MTGSYSYTHWTCPYCDKAYPRTQGYDKKGRRKRGDNEPIRVLCDVCQGKHDICYKCVRNSPHVFWDKPGGPMKVKWCAKSAAVLDAIEGPMRSALVCGDCETEPTSTVGDTCFCEKCKKRTKTVLKKLPANPTPPGFTMI